MTMESKLDFNLTPEWVDVAAEDGYTDLANANITIFPKYVSQDAVMFLGGATPPEGSDGIVLITGQRIEINAANIWVRGKGKLSFIVTAAG